MKKTLKLLSISLIFTAAALVAEEPRVGQIPTSAGAGLAVKTMPQVAAKTEEQVVKPVACYSIYQVESLIMLEKELSAIDKEIELLNAIIFRGNQLVKDLDFLQNDLRNNQFLSGGMAPVLHHQVWQEVNNAKGELQRKQQHRESKANDIKKLRQLILNQ